MINIVAVGARTPVGLCAKSAAAAVRAGICRVYTHPFFIDNVGEPVRAAIDSCLDINAVLVERIAELAYCSIAEIVDQLPCAVTKDQPIKVLLSLPETRPGFTVEDASEIMEIITKYALSLECSLDLNCVERGHAGVLRAVQIASDCLNEGDESLFLICGADSYLHDRTIAWLEQEDQIVKEGNRSGFIPGEAAGAVLLASELKTRQLGMPVLARLRGVATEIESKGIKGDVECLGEALSKTISDAIAPLHLPGEEIDAICCDINGERYRTEEWGLAFLRNQHAFRTSDYELPTSCWGDVGAATGALGCMLCVQAWRRGYAKGPRALVCAGSENGLRGAIVLEQSIPYDSFGDSIPYKRGY